MAGSSLKCEKCGRIFRQIHGDTTQELHEYLTEEEKQKFFGDDFFCCGKEYLKSLHELGMLDKIQELQVQWIKIMMRGK